MLHFSPKFCLFQTGKVKVEVYDNDEISQGLNHDEAGVEPSPKTEVVMVRSENAKN